MIYWPDILIVAILLIATIKGFKRGFISELAGAIALFAALAAPFFYNGFADAQFQAVLHLAPGSTRVVAMFIIGLLTYGAVMGISWVLNRFAQLPFVGLGNALCGGIVGFAKSTVFLWFVLFVALLFPLSKDLRNDLHRSRLVAILVSPDERIDNGISRALPWFVRPFAQKFLERHRV